MERKNFSEKPYSATICAWVQLIIIAAVYAAVTLLWGIVPLIVTLICHVGCIAYSWYQGRRSAGVPIKADMKAAYRISIRPLWPMKASYTENLVRTVEECAKNLV